jgi:hypothetical protein
MKAPTAEFEKLWHERDAAAQECKTVWENIRVILPLIQDKGGVATTQLQRNNKFEIRKDLSDDLRIKYEIMTNPDESLTYASGVKRCAQGTLEDLGDQLFVLDCQLMKASQKMIRAENKLKALIGGVL